MQITFERADPADAEILVNIQIAAFHSDHLLHPDGVLGGPPGYDSVEVALQKMAAHDFYKMLADGQIVGGMVITKEGTGYYHLDVIFIDPAFHNYGIGTQAMHFIEASYPARLLTLNTPIWARRNHHFYEKLGYVRTNITEYDGIRLINYQKRL